MGREADECELLNTIVAGTFNRLSIVFLLLNFFTHQFSNSFVVKDLLVNEKYVNYMISIW